MWDPAKFGLQPVQSSPDDWSEFGGPPSQSSPTKEGWAAFGGAPDMEPPPAAQAPASTPAPPAPSGMMANIGAGAAEGGAGVLNTLSDPFGNLIGKPLAVAGVTAHDLLAPVFGYDKFTPQTRAFILNDTVPQPGTKLVNAAADAMGATRPEDVQPATAGQSIARAGASGAVGMAGINGLLGAPTKAATAFSALLGGAGGVTGETASQLVPDQYKPVANLLGNVVGAGTVGGTVKVGGSAINSLFDYAAPALGREVPVTDGAGVPIPDARGQPITATRQQLTAAGDRIQGAASDPGNVQNALNTLLPGGPTREIVPGAAPTTAQATADPGLLQLERGVSRATPDAAADFKARADAQNDARVQAIQGVAQGADPAAVPPTVQRVVGNADAQVGQRVAGLQGQATQATDAIGGNFAPGSETTIGQMLRSPLVQSLGEARQAESTLWNAIDPNGSLATDMRPIRGQADQIAQGMSPNAAPFAGDEAAIMQTAQNLPDTQSFRDLAALRQRITDNMRAARSDPNRAQEVRRQTDLLNSVHAAMENGVQGQAASDAAAVQAGAMNPDQTMMARYQAVADQWLAGRNAQSATGTSGQGFASGGPTTSGSGTTALPGLSRAGGQANGGSAGASGYQGGLGSAAPLTPNFDAAAASRYAAARQATVDRVATYRNAPGVGPVLQQGSTAGSFKTPDSAVPNIIVKVGPQGADVVRAYQAAGGSPEALSEAAAFSLRQAAQRPDGTIDPAGYQRWASQRSSFLSALPPEVSARFRTAADAQASVNAAVDTRAASMREIQGSALGKFLGNADPVTTVAQVLRSPTSVADMRLVSSAVRQDPAALAGLQRAVAEHVLRDLKGNALGPTSTETNLKSDQFQTFLRKSGPALQEVLTPEQMTSLRNVAESLQQSNLSVAGSKLGGGSDTVQNAAAVAGGKKANLLTRIGHELAGTALGGGTGAALGSTLGGPIGAVLGSVGGGAIGKAVQAAREAGIQNVDHLVTQAMLNPALARVLLTKVTPQNTGMLAASLTAQLGRLSLISASQQPDRRKPIAQSRVNSLLH